mmetsp:Transcript_35635/g.113948  ORF Transcript_35635/g.113948 Transcript_35635/m.113948 type:complete len:408 (-) Transcript_35635:65-1288(-)
MVPWGCMAEEKSHDAPAGPPVYFQGEATYFSSRCLREEEEDLEEDFDLCSAAREEKVDHHHRHHRHSRRRSSSREGNRRKPCRRQSRHRHTSSDLIKQPSIVVGMWLLEAGPSDGNWGSLDAMMILSSTTNAARYMMGQAELDLSGFALHPNPADTFHAGSIHEWSGKGEQIPDVAKESGGAAGVRYRPFGGDDDRGAFMWICGEMVARSHDSVCFLCVDLLLHGPIRRESVKRLDDMGVFDRFKAGDPDALVARKPAPSSTLAKARLDEFEAVRAFPQKQGFDGSRISPPSSSQQPPPNVVTPPASVFQRRLDVGTGLAPPPLVAPEHASGGLSAGGDDFSLLDVDDDDYRDDFCGDDDESFARVSDRDSVDVPMDDVDDVQLEMAGLDLDREMVWATLVQGSRVL